MNAKLIYFSKTGNTRAYAERICEALQIEAIEIRPEEAYGSYMETVAREGLDRISCRKPAFEGESADLRETRYVLIGFPLWFGDVPLLVQNYISSLDLKDRKVIPFATSGGSKMPRAIRTLKKVCSGASIWLPFYADPKNEDYYRLWIDQLHNILGR